MLTLPPFPQKERMIEEECKIVIESFRACRTRVRDRQFCLLTHRVPLPRKQGLRVYTAYVVWPPM